MIALPHHSQIDGDVNDAAPGVSESGRVRFRAGQPAGEPRRANQE